jgi:hypothetical protein
VTKERGTRLKFNDENYVDDERDSDGRVRERAGGEKLAVIRKVENWHTIQARSYLSKIEQEASEK